MFVNDPVHIFEENVLYGAAHRQPDHVEEQDRPVAAKAKSFSFQF